MGPIKLDPKIMNQGKAWGYNWDNTDGDNHNGVADKIDDTIDGKDVTINVMSKMDASHSKPKGKNPGVDKHFLDELSKPQMDTVGEGKLSRSLKD